MRRLAAATLLVSVAACGIGGSTSPSGPVIRVQLRDDAFAPAGRNLLMITLPTGERVEGHTDTDGTADIRVVGAGVYVVRVIPRGNFISTDALTKSVAVNANATSVVDFVLYRGGTSEPTSPTIGNGD